MFFSISSWPICLLSLLTTNSCSSVEHTVKNIRPRCPNQHIEVYRTGRDIFLPGLVAVRVARRYLRDQRPAVTGRTMSWFISAPGRAIVHVDHLFIHPQTQLYHVMLETQEHVLG